MYYKLRQKIFLSSLAVTLMKARTLSAAISLEPLILLVCFQIAAEKLPPFLAYLCFEYFSICCLQLWLVLQAIHLLASANR